MTYAIALADLPTWNANSRGHWAQRAGMVAAWRNAAWACAVGSGIPQLERVEVELVMVPSDRRRRDPDNLSGALKPILDGLVDAGVIPDDSAKHVAKVALRMAEPDPSLDAHLWTVYVTEVAA